MPSFISFRSLFVRRRWRVIHAATTTCSWDRVLVVSSMRACRLEGGGVMMGGWESKRLFVEGGGGPGWMGVCIGLPDLVDNDDAIR